jgi:carbamate kinase
MIWDDSRVIGDGNGPQVVIFALIRASTQHNSGKKKKSLHTHKNKSVEEKKEIGFYLLLQRNILCATSSMTLRPPG